MNFDMYNILKHLNSIRYNTVKPDIYKIVNCIWILKLGLLSCSENHQRLLKFLHSVTVFFSNPRFQGGWGWELENPSHPPKKGPSGVFRDRLNPLIYYLLFLTGRAVDNQDNLFEHTLDTFTRNFFLQFYVSRQCFKKVKGFGRNCRKNSSHFFNEKDVCSMYSLYKLHRPYHHRIYSIVVTTGVCLCLAQFVTHQFHPSTPARPIHHPGCYAAVHFEGAAVHFWR